MYEIQFHPADIRKQVRYYFLSRRGFRWLVGGLSTVSLLLVAGVLLAPLGIHSLFLTSRLAVLDQQNEMQRQILDQRETALDRVERQVENARLRQQQIALILGASLEEQGLGGYPASPDPRIETPEARSALARGLKLESDTQALLRLADDLASFARENQALTELVPSICPVPVGNFVLSSPFGDRVSPFTNTSDFHAGIDLAAREGTPVLASGGGRVVFAGRFPLNRNVRWWRYGNAVVLAHGERYITIYAHLEEISVRRGQQVVRREQIGTVGNTGWSTSPHLHYEVRVVRSEDEEPVPVDPRIYVLDYQWTGHEALLIRARNAPAPAFDPLPSNVRLR